MAESNVAGQGAGEGVGSEERRVIFASSLGTVFEWYDFYLYATLALSLIHISEPTRLLSIS